MAIAVAVDEAASLDIFKIHNTPADIFFSKCKCICYDKICVESYSDMLKQAQDLIQRLKSDPVSD